MEEKLEMKNLFINILEAYILSSFQRIYLASRLRNPHLNVVHILDKNFSNISLIMQTATINVEHDSNQQKFESSFPFSMQWYFGPEVCNSIVLSFAKKRLIYLFFIPKAYDRICVKLSSFSTGALSWSCYNFFIQDSLVTFKSSGIKETSHSIKPKRLLKVHSFSLRVVYGLIWSLIEINGTRRKSHP